ncbi:hypothetical protein ACHAXS_008254 [Conticribra weissflogii]
MGGTIGGYHFLSWVCDKESQAELQTLYRKNIDENMNMLIGISIFRFLLSS